MTSPNSVPCPVCDNTGRLSVIRLPDEDEKKFKADSYADMAMSMINPNFKEKYRVEEACFNCEGKGVLEWED